MSVKFFVNALLSNTCFKTYIQAELSGVTFYATYNWFLMYSHLPNLQDRFKSTLHNHTDLIPVYGLGVFRFSSFG